MVEQYGRDLRYVHEWGTWLVWDGTRWIPDVTGEVMRRAKKTARLMLEEAGKIDEEGDRKALARHALRSEGSRPLKAMVELSTTEPGIPVG